MPATYLYEAALAEVLTLEPSMGPIAGGTAVAILGRGFQAGATVTIGGVGATSVVVVSADRLTAVTPAHALGAVDVEVTNPDASTGLLVEGFTYQATAPALATFYRTPAGAAASRLRLDTAAPRITHALGQAATFQFTAALEPAGKQRVEFRAFGVRLFLGTVTQKVERTDGAERLRVWDTTATDLAHTLTRRYPVGEWINVSASAILTALLAGWAPGFSSAGVEAALPPTTLKATGRADLWALIVALCDRVGAKPVLDGSTLRVFSDDAAWDPPDAVTAANPDLLWTDVGQPITIEWDFTQIRNRVTVYGADGIAATVDDPASIAAYDIIEHPIDDNTLTTLGELTARAQTELDAYAWPAPVVKYATRDLKTHVGKTVAINIDRPLIAGDFVITGVAIDQLELVERGVRPRFTVTARPSTASVRSAGDQRTRLTESVVDLAAAAARSPRLTGAIESEPGGRTTIPEDSIPATKLAGCIGSSLMTSTGVTPGAQGSVAHLVSFTVDAAGRITAATTDPVPVIKTDGSQPYTAPQSMGGFAITDVLDPVDPQDVATRAYVDAASAAAGATTILTAENPVGGFVSNETPAGAVDGANAVYTTALAYANLRVFLNGLRQKIGTDYTLTTATTFTFTSAPLTGDLLTVDYNGGATPEVVFDSFGDVITVTL